MPTREQALEFLKKYVQDSYQLHHAEMVETAMRAIAKYFGEDEELFGLAGLIHDWDFDQWPTEHPGHYEQLVAELNLSDDVAAKVIDAIKGHAYTDHPRTTKLSQAIAAADEFSGLLYAYMKMVGKYGDMKISSIAKKMDKELNFAAKIDRSFIKMGITELGIPNDEFYTLIRDAFASKYDN